MRLRVLMVEDSEDDLLLVLRQLQRGGYEPTYERVETPEAMKAALENQHWDLVLSDYNMPHFSGPAALELLQETGLDLPFIIVSGTIGEETAVAAMKAGAHDYLMKGNLTRLATAVERELGEAESRRERRQAEEALRVSEAKLRRQVRQRDALLKINEAVQQMAQPSDLEGVIEVCYEQLRALKMDFQALAIHHLIDKEEWLFESYEITSGKGINRLIRPLPNVGRMWQDGRMVLQGRYPGGSGRPPRPKVWKHSANATGCASGVSWMCPTPGVHLPFCVKLPTPCPNRRFDS